MIYLQEKQYSWVLIPDLASLGFNPDDSSGAPTNTRKPSLSLFEL